MSVPLAKIVFEHQTIPSAINCVCDELGISSKELERATADKRSEYPYMRTSSSTEHNSDMRHCDNLEKIFSLQKCAKKRDVDSNAASSNTANEVDLSLEMPILHDVTLDAAVMSDDNQVNSCDALLRDKMLEEVDEAYKQVEQVEQVGIETEPQ